MIQVNAIGDTCPIPVVKTKQAIQALGGAGVVQTLVDNEIAVQNLTKMAQQKGYGVTAQKLEEWKFQVTMTVGENAANLQAEEETLCQPRPASGAEKTVVVIAAATMGAGDDALGKTLMKGFLYALGQQDRLPETILLYNGGAALACEGSVSLEDLQSMEARGVEILTCGTCLNFYGLTEKLKVGGITNMYTIVEKMTHADRTIQT